VRDRIAKEAPNPEKLRDQESDLSDIRDRPHE
jgi:hypothetical protein